MSPAQSFSVAAALALSFLVDGCASPGPPRSPTLNLPGPVADLTALRRGNGVDLHFTLPQRNTDHLPLRGPSVSATLCRAVDTGACLPVAALSGRSFARLTNGHPTTATLHDALPAALSTGAPRLLAYRVELFNHEGHTAGFSDPAYSLAGAAPPEVVGLSAQGSRMGIVLSWSAAAPDNSPVVLRREDLAPKSPAPPTGTPPKTVARTRTALPGATKIAGEDEPNVVWLSTTPAVGAESMSSADIVLDATAQPEEPYRYAAERRRQVKLGGRELEMRSGLSAAISFMLHDIYPPPVPTDLTAASFAVSNTDLAAGFAVDLIWQPVDDPGLSGYNVYRQPVDANGAPEAALKRLNNAPVRLPAFHDVISDGTKHYRYSVTSVDIKGNESAACVTTVNPTPP